MYQSFDKASHHASFGKSERVEYDGQQVVDGERAKFEAQVNLRTSASERKRPDATLYESQYRKDMQGLSIDRRSMETSMLAYSERMKEITLQRSTHALQPLMVKPTHDGRRWASLSILNRNNRDSYRMSQITSFPERSMSADETQNSVVSLERSSLPDRPFSDTHNRMFDQLNDKQIRTQQDGQFFDQIRARMYHRREMGFKTLRKNMDKLPELKPHEEVSEDSYMPDERKNISIEVFPFPSIELQAVPAVLHRNPKAEKQIQHKRKSNGQPLNGEKKSYVYRPPVKTHKRGKVKTKAHNKSKSIKNKPIKETAHKVIPADTQGSSEKPKRKLNVKYLDVVKDALRNAVETFEGDLESVLKNKVINIPELKAEITRIRDESTRKKKKTVLKEDNSKKDKFNGDIDGDVPTTNKPNNSDSSVEDTVCFDQESPTDEQVALKSVKKKKVPTATLR